MASLTYFTVVGEYFAAAGEGPYDVGDPPLAALSGTIIFTPLVAAGSPIQGTTLAPPTNLLLAPVKAVVQNGQVMTNGVPGARLVANTPVLNLSGALVYQVSFEGGLTARAKTYFLNSFNFTAPTSDTTVDLVTVTPAPGTTAAGVTTISSVEISDATTIGKEILTAPNAATAMGYLTVNDAFNWQASNTRRWQRSRGNAYGGSGFSDIMIIGDSHSSGYMGNPTVAGWAIGREWARVLRNQLANRGHPIGGTGWVFTDSGGGNTVTNGGSTGQDPRWSFTGTWTGGYGFVYSSTNGATATFTSDVPGTTVQIAYIRLGGAFTYSVDGGAATTITPDTANTMSVITVSGLANTIHNVVITTTSTTNTFVYAAQVYGPSGVRVHNASIAGSSATQEWTSSLAGRRSPVTQAILPNPDIVLIALGANDLPPGGINATVAATITALTTIRGYWPNADFVLHVQPEPNFADIPQATWLAYQQQLYSLAVTLNCPLIDMTQRMGGFTTANANGQMATDGIHPTIGLQGDWGILMTNLLLRGM